MQNCRTESCRKASCSRRLRAYSFTHTTVLLLCKPVSVGSSATCSQERNHWYMKDQTHPSVTSCSPVATVTALLLSHQNDLRDFSVERLCHVLISSLHLHLVLGRLPHRCRAVTSKPAPSGGEPKIISFYPFYWVSQQDSTELSILSQNALFSAFSEIMCFLSLSRLTLSEVSCKK